MAIGAIVALVTVVDVAAIVAVVAVSAVVTVVATVPFATVMGCSCRTLCRHGRYDCCSRCGHCSFCGCRSCHSRCGFRSLAAVVAVVPWWGGCHHDEVYVYAELTAETEKDPS